MRAGFGELITEIQDADRHEDVPLGTAQWMGPAEAAARMSFHPETPNDRTWLGEACEPLATPLGYGDDRHVCLVSGTRGGKGTGLIVPNLCFWQGSCLVIDPKGENATVTARRRGLGSEYAIGLQQDVRILDPFGVVQLDPALKARFNPLDVIDPASDFAVDDAGRIAASIIVQSNSNDTFFEDAARNYLKGLILHVLSASIFEGMRNLITVRRLLTRGDWLRVTLLRDAGEKDIPSAFTMLWKDMQRSTAFDGVVAGVGEQMVSMAEKTRSSILETARTNTAFLDGAPMQRLLSASDFDLAGLKTAPKGLTIYLTLPQRHMDTHFRWLRLMVSLAVGEMERINGKPRTGFPTLFLLDEFAGLKRMEVIENAVAQAAGFGVKFFFVLQNLAQLKKEYQDSWESFVSNSGLKIFFQIDDHFTREYLTHLLGEREVTRESRSGSQSWSDSVSNTVGDSISFTDGTSDSWSKGSSKSTSQRGGLLGMFYAPHHQRGTNRSRSWSRSHSKATGMSTSRSDTQSVTKTDGWSGTVHKRSLLNPDEIGRFLSRIDESSHPAYPGLLLALIPGRNPLIVRRVNYFQSPRFAGFFDPHPNYPPPPTIAERLAAARNAVAPKSLPSPPVSAAGLTGKRIAILAGVAAIVLFLIVIVIAHMMRPSPIAAVQSPDIPAPAQPPPALRTQAFRDGVAARLRWENWVNELHFPGSREGAEYWAGARNTPDHESCNAAMWRLSPKNLDAFGRGCASAKALLDPVDTRRRTEPDYWWGWNSR